MTTRSGGQGLTLTSANVCILYDIDYNPYVLVLFLLDHNQMDKQAEDRVHRIGQEKEVFVHRLIMKNTVDESIYSISQNKEYLEEFMLKDNHKHSLGY